MGIRGDVLTRVAAPVPARPARRWRWVGVLTAVLVVAAALVVVARSRAGGALPLPTAADAPAAYHIVYRVTAGGVVTTEDLWVNRPFDSVDLTYAGTTVGGTPLSTIATRLGRQLLHVSSGAATVLEPPPVQSPFDVRLDTLVGAPADALLISARGQMRVLDRSCRVYRTAQALSAATLSGAATNADHVDTCVDQQGLVLDERHVTGGRLSLQRTAVSVAVGDDAARHPYATDGSHLAVDQGGGKVVTLSSDSRAPGQPSLELPQPPAGFTSIGRFAVVPPRGRGDFGFVGAVDDVYVRGPDVIVIEQAQTAGPDASVPIGDNVDLGPHVHATLALSARGPAISATQSPTSYVTVRGTLPLAELVSVARALRPQPAGTLTPIADVTSDGP